MAGSNDLSNAFALNTPNLNNFVMKINDILRKQCQIENFFLMSQTAISNMKHLWKDGLHLNKNGTSVLQMNILVNFRTFVPEQATFYKEYQAAL